MEIRAIRPDEHAEVAALTVAAYQATHDDLPASYLAELADVGARAAQAEVLVAVEGGQLLGGLTYVADVANPLAEHTVAHAATIRMLAVAPAAVRRGAGRALTQACVARAASEGKEAVVLHTVDTNEGGLAFYEALGFERVPELDWEPEPGVHLVGLRLEVAFAG